MTFFTKSTNKKNYTNTVDKFFFMLKSLNESPKGVFGLTCALSTHNNTMHKFLRVAMEQNLITSSDKIFYLTDKGRSLIQVWNRDG